MVLSMFYNGESCINLGYRSRCLNRYYSQFQSFSDSITASFKRTDGLAGNLKASELILHDTEARNDAVMEQLHRAIDACGTVLLTLTTMAKEYGETSVQTTFEDKKRLFKKRSLWPLVKRRSLEPPARSMGCKLICISLCRYRHVSLQTAYEIESWRC